MPERPFTDHLIAEVEKRQEDRRKLVNTPYDAAIGQGPDYEDIELLLDVIREDAGIMRDMSKNISKLKEKLEAYRTVMGVVATGLDGHGPGYD